MNASRREILIGTATLPLLASGAVAGTADELWPQWQAEWRRIEAIARARNWSVTPLRIEPPATSLRLKALEKRLGLPFPTQLRGLMLRFSCKVAFGWHVPSHLMPMDLQNIPTGSSLRDAIWDIDYMTRHAIPGFLGWKENLKDRDRSESPNRPEMWENQFPLSEAANGDMITIDVTNRDGPQPVRYFSHELEGLHHTALAPDFFSFVTVLSKLGWAGTEQDSWGPFLLPADGDKRYLSAETAGARTWLAWLAQDPVNPPPGEPPMVIAAETTAERALLKAAEDGSLAGVRAALAAGARPNVVRHGDDLLRSGKWDWKFATALTHAVRRDDLDMARLLVSRGASLNLRRLAVNDAADHGLLETLRWTLEQGGRATGWRHDRYHPIHTLLGKRIDEGERKRGWDQYDAERRQKGEHVPDLGSDLWKPLDEPTILAMLDLLIAAGAEVDARWDNGLTMLMFTRSIPVTKRLLAARARVDLRDSQGQSVMHWAQRSAKARLLMAAGADINALSTPRADDEQFLPCTPLQWQLVGNTDRHPDMRETLLELGADPTIRDGRGRSTLAWVYSVGDFERIRGFGLDPLEKTPDGDTLLIQYLRRGSIPRQAGTLALIDHLLSLGIGINERDANGRTALHVLAERGIANAEDVQLLLGRGADKDLRDAQGRRAFDLALASETELREALR